MYLYKAKIQAFFFFFNLLAAITKGGYLCLFPRMKQFEASPFEPGIEVKDQENRKWI